METERSGRSWSGNRRPRPAILASAMGLLACILAAGGCSTGQQPVPSVQAQLSGRIERSRELALAAQKAENDGKPEEAIKLYSQAVGEYREYPAAWTNLGRLLEQRGDGIEAAKAYRLAADYAPTSPEPLYNLGALWESRGYAEDAAKYYDQALGRDENYLPALRRSIYLDQHVLMRGGDATALRLRRALLLETDPTWKSFFEREKVRIDNTISSGDATRIGS